MTNLQQAETLLKMAIHEMETALQHLPIGSSSCLEDAIIHAQDEALPTLRVAMTDIKDEADAAYSPDTVVENFGGVFVSRTL